MVRTYNTKRKTSPLSCLVTEQLDRNWYIGPRWRRLYTNLRRLMKKYTIENYCRNGYSDRVSDLERFSRYNDRFDETILGS